MCAFCCHSVDHVGNVCVSCVDVADRKELTNGKMCSSETVEHCKIERERERAYEQTTSRRNSEKKERTNE